MPIVANGQYLPTESGLSATGGVLDRLQQAMDANATYQGNLRGYGPALREAGIPIAAPRGMLDQVLGAFGLGPQQSPSQMPSAASSPGPSTGASPAPSTSTNVNGDVMGLFRNAIAGVESKGSGDYNAIGVDTGGGNRALGKYQVMASNVGPWTKELLGQEMTPQQFLASPQAQDAVFNGKFGQYLSKTGNPQDAASMWFTGRPLAQGAGAQDQLGTTGAGYVQKFMAGLPGAGGLPAQATAYAPGDTSPEAQTLGGAAPMPIATGSPTLRQAPQPGSQPTFGGSPAWIDQVKTLIANPDTRDRGLQLWQQQLQAQQQPQQRGLNLPTGLSRQALAAMIAEPTTQKAGLALWAQALSPKDTKLVGDGQWLTTAEGVPLFHAPDKPIATREGGSIYDPSTKSFVATNPKTETATFQAPNGDTYAFDKSNPSAPPIRLTPQGAAPGYRPATAQERAAFNVQPDAPLMIGPDGKPATLNSGQNVTVNTGADPIMGAVGDRFKTSLESAVAASQAIPAIRTARAQLDQGIISGAGANQVLGLQKIAVQLGLPGADVNRIINTETFRAAVGPVVLKTVKGLGAGAGISNADRDFAERMAGGNITLDDNSIRRILDIQERAAGATIAQHNALAKQMQGTPAGAAAYRNVGGGMQVEMPTAQTPGGASRTIGGVTYTQGPDGHWYTGAP